MPSIQPTRFRPVPLAAALAALLAAPGAQALEVVPLDVAEAYIGVATPGKLDAALVGMRRLITELPLITPPGSCWYCGVGSINIGVNTPPNFGITISTQIPVFEYFAAPLEEFFIAGDADLAPLGEPARLAHTRLTLGASFATARDFVIGSPSFGPDYHPLSGYQSVELSALRDEYGNPMGDLQLSPPPRPYVAGPGFIDTNGYDFRIAGVLTAHQTLYKEGEGTLWLTGANVWNAIPQVRAGVLKGDTASLDTPIANAGRVEFHQQGDGIYRHALSGDGALIKTGTGILTLTAAQQYGGATTVAEGTLALAEWGRLPDASQLVVAAGGTLDVAGVWVDPVLKSLEGEGRVVLGRRGLDLEIARQDTSFAGEISGDGPLTVRSQPFALTGRNSFTGGLTVTGTTLGIGQGASLGAGVVRLDDASLRMLAPIHATQNLRVDGAGNLDSNGYDLAWSGDITGNGRLYKTGDGVLTLFAGNSFTGEFTVGRGTLRLAGAGRLDEAGRMTVNGVLDLAQAGSDRRIKRLEGSGSVLLGSSGMILGIDGADSGFYGTISGAGGITKLGMGEQALYGASDYAGPTTILAGTLRVAPQALGNRVVNHATLAFQQDGGLNNIAAWSGDIEGSGRVVKSGDGVLWLRDRNTHTGGTLVEKGALIGNTDSLPGDIETRAGLAFYQVTDGNYAGRVSGTGTLMSYGPGALALSGDNTHSGGTAFSNTLRVSRDVNLGGPASGLLIAGGTLQALDYLTLNRHVALGEAGARFDSNGFAITLNGLINGPGGVTKLGEGVLFLAGEHGYSGATRVEQGGMVVNGSFAGDVQVLDGAWFQAKGRVGGDLLVAEGASFSAGNSPGSLLVDGDLRAEGEIVVEITSLTEHDLTLVGGVADLTGAHFRFQLLDGALPGEFGGLTFLGAAGGITGLDSARYSFDSNLDGYRVALVDNTLQLAPVPEPETWAMLLIGLGLVGGAVRRRAILS